MTIGVTASVFGIALLAVLAPLLASGLSKLIKITLVVDLAVPVAAPTGRCGRRM